MTIEEIYNEYESKKAHIDAMYEYNYASIDATPQSTLELNIWYENEKEKLKKWLVTTIQQNL